MSTDRAHVLSKQLAQWYKYCGKETQRLLESSLYVMKFRYRNNQRKRYSTVFVNYKSNSTRVAVQNHSDWAFFFVSNKILITIYFLFSLVPSSGPFRAIDKNSVCYRHLSADASHCPHICTYTVYIIYLLILTNHLKNILQINCVGNKKRKHIENPLNLVYIYTTCVGMSVCECVLCIHERVFILLVPH